MTKFGPLIADARATKRQLHAFDLYQAARGLLEADGASSLEGYTPHLRLEHGDLTLLLHSSQNAVPSAKPPHDWAVDDEAENRRVGVEVWCGAQRVLRVVSSEISGTVIELFKSGSWEETLLTLVAGGRPSKKLSPSLIVSQTSPDDSEEGDDDFED